MSTVILVIHLMIATALVALILLQRSEGGALGIGGGGGGGAGGFMSGRGAANLLTRATAVLAAAFFVTSIGLTILARQQIDPDSILDNAASQRSDKPGDEKGGLAPLQPSTPEPPSAPSVPQPQ